jgi:hypothetical protein
MKEQFDDITLRLQRNMMCLSGEHGWHVSAIQDMITAISG